MQGWRSFLGHLAASLAAVSAYHFAWREVTYKLADQVMVRADVAGFRELAADHPLGAVDWCLRLLAASNLEWWGGLAHLAVLAAVSTLAYFALRRCNSQAWWHWSQCKSFLKTLTDGSLTFAIFAAAEVLKSTTFGQRPQCSTHRSPSYRPINHHQNHMG